MKKRTTKVFIISAIALCLSNIAQAQIVVDDMVHTFTGDKSELKKVTVHNKGGKGPLAVQAVIEEVLNVGTTSQIQKKSKDFFIVPPMLHLGEGYSKRVRLIWQGKKAESDRFYRIKFVPSKALKIDKPETSEGITTQVNVLTGSGILAIVRPKETDESLVWERGHDAITFTNKGNTHTVLRPKVCLYGKNCRLGEQKRLLSGKEWEFNIPTGMEFEDIEFERKTTSQTIKLTIPYSYE